jgi:hypothetical protein
MRQAMRRVPSHAAWQAAVPVWTTESFLPEKSHTREVCRLLGLSMDPTPYA